MREQILENTKKQLMHCKDALAPLQPVYYVGAGLRFVSLAAKQVFFEKSEEGNQLGWEKKLEDTAWIIKHQREVNRFTQYCQCCCEMSHQGQPIDVILQQCGSIEPDTLIGPSFLFSEGLQKAIQWLYAS